MTCPTCVPAHLCRCGFVARYANGSADLAARERAERLAIEASVEHLQPTTRAKELAERMGASGKRFKRGERKDLILAAMPPATWLSVNAVWELLPPGFERQNVARRLAALHAEGALDMRTVADRLNRGMPRREYSRRA